MSLLGRVLLSSTALVVATVPSPAHAARPAQPAVSRLVSGLQGGIGSTLGPDGALYVPEGAAGRITRVDPRTGATTPFASGLPRAVPAIGIGGPMDVAFLGGTAYVLVSLVDPGLGGASVDGIYRVDGPTRFTVVADIGAYAASHPPNTSFFNPTGLQYAMEPDHGGFLVTDGHHNRMYRVTLDGNVTELIAFDNVVPTGLAIRGRTVYVAQAGPVPHLPETGKVVRFRAGSTTATEVASGARLLVDVQFGRGRRLYALSQGIWGGGPDGSPALPGTGALLQVTHNGTLTTIADGLNLPTSLELLGDTAYVVTLAGEVWRIAGVQNAYDR